MKPSINPYTKKIISSGENNPLGADLGDNGVNFAIYSK